MQRIIAAAIHYGLAIVLLMSTSLVWASFDEGCDPEQTLSVAGGCGEFPLLLPTNDTRTNLGLLLVDQGRATVALDLGTEDYPIAPESVVFPLQSYRYYSAITALPITTNTTIAAATSAASIEDAGAPCQSNDGKAQFIAAVNAESSINASEKQLLIQERTALAPECESTTPTERMSAAILKKVNSPTAKLFASYYIGAQLFYGQQYRQAATVFQAFEKIKHPWLSETAAYMQARSNLSLAAQLMLNKWSDEGTLNFDLVDKQQLSLAEKQLNAYLITYPKGRYAASANGLLRRVYWLGQRLPALEKALMWQMDHLKHPWNNIDAVEFLNEVDNKVLTGEINTLTSPTLVFTEYLRWIRNMDTQDAKSVQKVKAIWPTVQQKLSSDNNLKQYAQWVYWLYVSHEPAKVIEQATTVDTKPRSYFALSQAALVAMAYDDVKQYAKADAIWSGLLQAPTLTYQLELAQMMHAIYLEYAGQVNQVFVANSPIKNTLLRERLITHSANVEVLKQVVQSKTTSQKEKQIAGYMLYGKLLLTGQYAALLQAKKELHSIIVNAQPKKVDEYELYLMKEFEDALPVDKADWTCGNLWQTVEQLAANPKDNAANLCLGDVVRTRNINLSTLFLYGTEDEDKPNAQRILGQYGQHQFQQQYASKVFTRGDVYLNVVKQKSSNADEKAYALYRLVYCYAPSAMNTCDNEDVDISVRKQWFNTLKTDYGQSKWAKQLKYYW